MKNDTKLVILAFGFLVVAMFYSGLSGFESLTGSVVEKNNFETEFCREYDDVKDLSEDEYYFEERKFMFSCD